MRNPIVTYLLNQRNEVLHPLVMTAIGPLRPVLSYSRNVLYIQYNLAF